MNKLTIEEKTIIAEKVHELVVLDGQRYVHTKDGTLSKYTKISNYNPDQDLTQFVEMIGALDYDQKIQVNQYLRDKYLPYYILNEGMRSMVWLCSHKYEVCKAVIEVVK